MSLGGWSLGLRISGFVFLDRSRKLRSKARVIFLSS